MSETNNPVADEPTENSAVDSNPTADSFFAAESAALTQPSRNFWAKPAVAIAGAAIASGVLGFAIGNHASPDMRPAAISGEAFEMHGGVNGMEGPGDRGMFGQPGGKHRGPGMMGQPGQGMAPHCHDAAGNDTAANPDGTCLDGSTPGFMPQGGQAPDPSASSTTSVQ
jgi:hypothetical protein